MSITTTRQNAGQRIPWGSDVSDPEFWRRLRNAKVEHREGTFSALIADFKAIKFGKLRPETRRGYTHCLHRLETMCGDRQVAALTRRDIYALLDQMKETPTVANLSSIHGLRSTKIHNLRKAGTPDGAIADEIGMSVKMVSRPSSSQKTIGRCG